MTTLDDTYDDLEDLNSAAYRLVKMIQELDERIHIREWHAVEDGPEVKLELNIYIKQKQGEEQ